MNRNLRESVGGGRNTPAAISQFRRGSNTGFSRDSDENLDLFSKIRRSFPLSSSSDHLPDVSAKLGRLSVGSKPAPRGKGGDDLLSSAEVGKNDYDWLLTPPGTPLGNDSHSSLAPPKIASSARASSASKASRLSVSQSETSYHPSRPARSSSLTRPSISTSGRSPSSILNTSSASVSSYIRPSSPSSRPSSSARTPTPTRTTSLSRASTPSRIRPVSSTSSLDKARPSLSSRPSTPTSRTQHTSNSPNIVASRPNSRPSTPTRRSTSTSASPGGRGATKGHSAPSLSRPSSPGPRVRTTTPQQPIVLPDFPLDTPPNLRTTLQGRPVSAGRSRPVAAKASPEPKGPMTRRNSSPVVTRGRLIESQGKSRSGGNGQQHNTDAPEPRRISSVSDVTSRRTLKTSLPVMDNNNGLGRSLSKSSLDMAIKHMDIRNGKSNGCALSSTTLFPQSIRQASSKIQPVRSGNNLSDSISSNSAENGNETNEGRRLMGKLGDRDMYESSRYDALLLKEDVRNTNWLHSIDDRSSEHGHMFDNGGFELLPEPFAPL
ncbi:hypothetical protein Bca4012_066267 [Brassica carinata]|uniref:Uncharacterized protein n=1 Tax=Brassica carinata TaxID=52824 RepID=A0A8X7VQR3_BRACI|nr:hypothetical protein Bca52824_018574 [Brassica carinata]